MVLLSLEADQQADVKQSGDAGAGQAQANRLNVAHWNGLVATPEPPADAGARGRAAHGRRVAVPPAVSEVEVRPAVRRARAGRADAPGRREADARAVRRRSAAARTPALQVPAGAVFSPRRRPRPGSWRPRRRPELARAHAGRAAAGRTRRPQRGPRAIRSLVCPTCGSSSLFGAIEGAHDTGFAGGVVARLSRFRLFAPSGAGRVRPDAPALGLPVEIAALERPG